VAAKKRGRGWKVSKTSPGRCDDEFRLRAVAARQDPRLGFAPRQVGKNCFSGRVSSEGDRPPGGKGRIGGRGVGTETRP